MCWQSKDTALVYNMTYSDIYDFFSKRSRRSQVYPLMFGSQKIPVYCHMENFGCGGGGWTLAMKINGAKVNSLPSKKPLDVVEIKKKKETKNWKLSSLSFREPSIMIPTSGATKMSIILLEARLALTHRRPNYQLTGIHPSTRSALAWRLVINSGLFWLTGAPTHCSHWSLMGNTAPPHWVVTRGSGWLVHRPPCSPTAIRKDSMRWETTLVFPKQESVSPLTRRMTVVPVTHASVLAQEVYMMILTRAEMRQRTRQIMETSTSKPWGTSWYSDRGHS